MHSLPSIIDKSFRIKMTLRSNLTLTDKYDNLNYEQLNSEIHKYRNELENVKKDLDILKSELKISNEKILLRENELREHIRSLIEKLKHRDINAIKDSMTNLNKEIIRNISELNLKRRFEIKNKKKDIENRIKLRIYDMNSTFNKVLYEKDEQNENTRKSLEELTVEFNRISDNFYRINSKHQNLIFENRTLNERISNFETKNAKLKLELMNLKSELDNYKYEKENLSSRAYSIKKRAFSIGISSHARSRTLNQVIEQQNNFDPYELTVNLINKLSQSELFQEPKIKKIFNNFVKIYENNKSKTNLIKKKIDKIEKEENEIQKSVLEVIKEMKFETFNKNSDDLIKYTRNQFFSPNIEYYISKEERSNFIDNLFKNEEIINFINSKKSLLNNTIHSQHFLNKLNNKVD